MKKTIDAAELLGNELLDVTAPGRYVGGEYGVTKAVQEGMITVGVCFPDLYEIGMSNSAIKILYDIINKNPGCAAQRVFAPAPDFAALLKEKQLSLFTLESHLPVHQLDVLAVSVGYELSATNVLKILETGGIPIHADTRGEDHPVVIAGGPAVTNPAPFEQFFDAFFIGEAEESLDAILTEIRQLKQNGGSRAEVIGMLESFSCIYTAGKPSAKRCFDAAFAHKHTAVPVYYTVPSVSVVQDHGAAEIMRGCPNGCRFCHAGIIYRPFREASGQQIFSLVDHLVFEQGYDNITLSSLSTGDYHGLSQVVRNLDKAFGPGNVSFSLPSLKIDSFTLGLLEDVSKVRKSGLTFAVETPNQFHQMGINKEVPADKVLEILADAKKRGWKLAKFYFMIGLPGIDSRESAQQIIEYIRYVEQTAKINLHVNIGTFIPKPHTPYQWSRQLDEDEALEIFREIKAAFAKNRYVKVSYHDTFTSMLEGIISRGDKRVGELIETAYRKGAYLDAWGDHFNKEAWVSSFESVQWDVVSLLRERSVDEPLPWDGINIGVSKAFLRGEYEKTFTGELTTPCDNPCTHLCGVCGKQQHPEIVDITQERAASLGNAFLEKHKSYYESHISDLKNKILLKFTKEHSARFLSHINVMKVFERSFRRAEIPIAYTQGFNPKPKIDFAHPLSLGVSSTSEYLVFHTSLDFQELQTRITSLSEFLPEGIAVQGYRIIDKPGKFSLMAQYGGAAYYLHTDNPEEIDRLSGLHDHLDIQHRDESGVICSIFVTPGKPDLLKLVDDKYAFIKKYRPIRVETYSTEKLPMDQSSFLA